MTRIIAYAVCHLYSFLWGDVQIFGLVLTVDYLLIAEFSVVLYVLSDSPLSDVTFQTFSPSRGLTHRLSWGFVF